MDIQIIEGIDGAQQAADIAVVIDVLRAATVAAYLLDAGVSSIIPVSTSDEALNRSVRILNCCGAPGSLLEPGSRSISL